TSDLAGTPPVSLPVDYTFTADPMASPDNGSHTFSTFVLVTGPSQTVTVTDTGNNINNFATINITGTTADHFDLTGPATPPTAGSGFSVTVTAKDHFGNPSPSYSGTVHITVSDGTSPEPSGIVFTAGNPTNVVPGVVIDTSGPQSVTATDTAAMTGTVAVTINAGAATHLVITPPAPTATAGTSFTLTVTAKDGFGNTDPTFADTVQFSTSDPGAAVVLPGNFSAWGGTGQHIFASGFTLVTAPSETVTVTDITPSSTVTGATVT